MGRTSLVNTKMLMNEIEYFKQILVLMEKTFTEMVTKNAGLTN